MAEKGLTQARDVLATLLGHAFARPLTARAFGRIEGVLFAIACFEDCWGARTELEAATVLAHYSRLWSLEEEDKPARACGCGGTHLCRRERTGFDHLVRVIRSTNSSIARDLGPEDSDEHAIGTTLVADPRDKHWPIRTDGEPRLKVMWGQGADADRTLWLPATVAFVLARAGRPLTVRAIADQIGAYVSTVEINDVLMRMSVYGRVEMKHHRDLGGGHEFGRWSFVWAE